MNATIRSMSSSITRTRSCQRSGDTEHVPLDGGPEPIAEPVVVLDQIDPRAEQRLEAREKPGEREQRNHRAGIELHENVDVALRTRIPPRDRAEQGYGAQRKVAPQTGRAATKCRDHVRTVPR